MLPRFRYLARIPHAGASRVRHNRRNRRNKGGDVPHRRDIAVIFGGPSRQVHRKAFLLTVGATGAATLAGLGLLDHMGSRPALWAVSLPYAPFGVSLDTQAGRTFIFGATLPAGVGRVDVYDLRTGTLIRTLSPFSPNVEVTVVASLRRAVVTDNSGLVTTLDSGSGRVLGTTVAGGDPTFVDADAQTGRMALTNPNRDSIDVVDARTGRLVQSVYLSPFAEPRDVRVDWRAGRAFSMNVGAHTVSVIDVGRGRVLRTVPATFYPSVAVDGRHGRAFVTTSREVLMLNAASGKTLRTIPIHADPQYGATVTVDERSGRAFAGDGRAVYAVDTRTGALLWTGPRHAGVVGIDERDNSIYVRGDDGRLSALDGRTGAFIWTLAGGHAADAVVFDPARGHVLVASSGAVDATGIATGTAMVDLFDVHSGGMRWSRPVGVGQVSLTVDEQAGYAIVVTGGGTLKGADPLRWLPSWARRFPFIPPPRPTTRTLPARMIALDVSH